MTYLDILAAMDLPPACLVNQRVPKKLFLENGAPTSSDKRQINSGINEIIWLAALKPNTIGVPSYRDEIREYLEIAVLSVSLHPHAKLNRLTELLHRAVPYPLVLCMSDEEGLSLSLVHKRWAQNEAGKTVLDCEPLILEGLNGGHEPHVAAFLGALALPLQTRTNMFDLYQGLQSTLLAFLAARQTGRFSQTDSLGNHQERHDTLRDCEQLQAEIASLRKAAQREKQVARQVALNQEVKPPEAELQQRRNRV